MALDIKPFFICTACFLATLSAAPLEAQSTETAPSLAATPETLRLQADQNERQGNLHEAIALRLRALATDRESLGDQAPALIIQHTKLAQLYLDLGQLYKAEEQIAPAVKDSIEIFGIDDRRTMEVGATYVRLLRAQKFQSGAERMALLFLNAAQDVYGSASVEARVWKFTYAGVLNDGGRYDEAAPLFSQLVQDFRRIGDDYATGYALFQLAFTQSQLGETGAALNHINQALLIAARNPDLAQAAEARMVLIKGRALSRSGDFSAAIAVLEPLYREQSEALPSESNFLSQIEWGYALALMRAGHATDAVPLFANQLAQAESRLAEDDPLLVEPLADYGAALIALPERRAEAVDPLRRAAALIDWRRDRGGITAAERQVYDGRRGFERQVFRDLVSAEWAQDSSSGQVRPISPGAFEALQNALSGTTDVAVVRKGARERAIRKVPGFRQLIDRRDRLVKEISELRERAALETSTGRLSKPQNIPMEKTVVGQRIAAEDALSDIDERILASTPSFFVESKVVPLTIAQARSLLRKDEAAVLIVPTDTGTFVALATSDGVKWQHSNRTARAMRKDVTALRDTLDQVLEYGYYNRSFDRSKAHDLYRELLAPFANELKGRTHLFFSASGALAALPPAVLITEPPTGKDYEPQILRDTAWLDRSFTLAQVPSLRALAFLRETENSPPQSSKGERRKFDGFGAPVLTGDMAASEISTDKIIAVSGSASSVNEYLADPSALRALGSLPGTIRELQGLLTLFGLSINDRAVRLGPAATESAVKQADLSHTQVLAFATHGLLPGELEGSLQPGLVLTPPPDGMQSRKDDGYLTALEVTELDLTADWVILSACNTAAGGTPGGEGLSGLARGFFSAGAHSLLATHWPVRDDVASELVPATLKRWIASDYTIDRAVAFNASMQAVRNDTEDESRAHPAAWATFVLVGDR